MAQLKQRLYRNGMTQSKRPLSMISPEYCVGMVLGGGSLESSLLVDTLSAHEIVTISELEYMETFRVSGTLLSVLGDNTKRQLIICSDIQSDQLVPSVLWALENGLDVFVALASFDLNTPEQEFTARRLSASGAIVMSDKQCIAELNWPIRGVETA